jgi:hypothetical protein
LIAGGRLGDMYGRKRMFQIGVTSFTLISLLCGLAPSTGALILLRLLQGFAAATMIPQGFGLIRESFLAGGPAEGTGLLGTERGDRRAARTGDRRTDHRAGRLWQRLARCVPRQRPDRDRRGHRG